MENLEILHLLETDWFATLDRIYCPLSKLLQHPSLASPVHSNLLAITGHYVS